MATLILKLEYVLITEKVTVMTYKAENQHTLDTKD